jgi:hypothetical protein
VNSAGSVTGRHARRRRDAEQQPHQVVGGRERVEQPVGDLRDGVAGGVP